MMTTTDMSWVAEKRLDERYYYSIAAIRAHVYDVPPGSSEIGFTSIERDIYLAKECEITRDLDEDLKRLFRLGVFAHELLHQLYTDFPYIQSALSRHARKEATVLRTLINVIEDPAIEYNADNAFGGSLLDALRYCILSIYRWSPPIDESGSAWSQFINALIQFGDVGIIKGDFTYPEAYEAFKLIASEFLEMVADPVSTHRIDAAERWLDMTRFLWEAESDESLKSAETETGKNMGSASPKGGGRQKSFPEEERRETDVDKNRRKTLKQAQNDETKDPAGNAEKPGTAQNEASNEGLNGSGSEDESGSNAEGGPVDEDGHGAKGTSGETAGGVGSGELDTDSAEDGTLGNSGYDDDDIDELFFGDNPVKKAPGKKLGTKLGTDPEEANKNAGKVITFDPAAAKSVSDEVAKEERIIEKKAKEEMLHAKECETIYGEVKVFDDPVQPDKAAEENYKEICSRYGRDINLLSASLHKILVQDVDTSVRSLSGRYNEKRALTRSTVKIFDKRREAKNIADIAVMLAVDESGSMHGSKMRTARETAIILAETLSRLKVPCYIMGFTADYKGYDAYHEHFVRWKNTPKERASLAKFEAKANNFDGFSIRHASLILKKKRAEHKIMFIISDGLPACQRYIGRGGIEDTAKAIREASHTAGVIGIGVGIDEDSMQKGTFTTMYGRTPFIPVKDPEELKTTLASTLKAVMRTI